MIIDIARTSSLQLAAGSVGVLGTPQAIDLAPGVYYLQTDGDVRASLNGTVSPGSMRLAAQNPVTVRLRARTRLTFATYDGTSGWVWVCPVDALGGVE